MVLCFTFWCAKRCVLGAIWLFWKSEEGLKKHTRALQVSPCSSTCWSCIVLLRWWGNSFWSQLNLFSLPFFSLKPWTTDGSALGVPGAAFPHLLKHSFALGLHVVVRWKIRRRHQVCREEQALFPERTHLPQLFSCLQAFPHFLCSQKSLFSSEQRLLERSPAGRDWVWFELRTTCLSAQKQRACRATCSALDELCNHYTAALTPAPTFKRLKEATAA